MSEDGLALGAGEDPPFGLAPLRATFSHVGFLVDPERLLPAEALGTLRAGVGPLPRVDPAVRHQLLLLPEALATGGAGVRPLPPVHLLVGAEIGGLAEPLPTVSAEIGLLPRVDPLVPPEVLP